MKNLIIKLFNKFRRLIVFGFVGVLNTLVDYGIFALMYELAGLPAAVSQFVGYMSGSVFGYFVNSNVTFREGKGRTKAQWAQYFGVDIALTLLSGGFMHWVEQAGLPVYLFKIVTTVAVALIHYIIYKYLVFKIRKEEDTCYAQRQGTCGRCPSCRGKGLCTLFQLPRGRRPRVP